MCVFQLYYTGKEIGYLHRVVLQVTTDSWASYYNVNIYTWVPDKRFKKKTGVSNFTIFLKVVQKGSCDFTVVITVYEYSMNILFVYSTAKPF